MSATFLRLGLYLLVATLALFVVDTTWDGSIFAELITNAMLYWFAVVGVVLIGTGMVLRVLERGAKAVGKNRCRVCKTPIPAGGIYCREHLRGVLDLEDRRTHSTRLPPQFR